MQGFDANPDGRTPVANKFTTNVNPSNMSPSTMKRSIFALIFVFTLVHGSHDVCSQETTERLLGNSSDGSHDSSDHADKIAAETIKSVLANPDYTEAQKKRIVDAIKSSSEQTEVFETLQAGGIEIDHAKEKPIGYLSIRGNFSTTEISGCWMDQTLVQSNARIYKKQIGKRDVLVVIEEGDWGPVISHNTGARCGVSDQGPMVTDPGSSKMLALGYYDPKADTYTMMLEGSDVTHWTLTSGGEVGAASFLKFYLPDMRNTDAGSLSAFSVSKKQAASGETVFFKGKVTGPGSTTVGVVGLMFSLGESTPSEDMETQERFFADVGQQWKQSTKP